MQNCNWLKLLSIYFNNNGDNNYDRAIIDNDTVIAININYSSSRGYIV